jgi:competence protein ComEA
MSAFFTKGKYILITISLLFIIGLVMQLVSDDKQNEFKIQNEISRNTDSVSETADPDVIDKTPTQTDSETQVSSDTAKEIPQSEELEAFPVYLVGAVKNPGIYTINSGAYLFELIEMAGGMTEEAAAESINLAAAINSNQLIRIPTEADILNDPDLKYITEDEPENMNQKSENNLKDGLPRLININQAGSSELEELPGIGNVTAQLIISYRQKNGDFSQIEDIMKVSGIKESRFERIRELITVK